MPLNPTVGRSGGQKYDVAKARGPSLDEDEEDPDSDGEGRGQPSA
jgi:hypothetical protein